MLFSTFCKAIWKGDLDIDKLKAEGIVTKNTKLNKGEIACYLSHLSVLRNFLHSNDRTCLTFEDDIAAPKSNEKVDEILKDSLQHLPKEWDVLYLSRTSDYCQLDKKISKFLVQNYYPTGGYAFAFTRKAAKKILNVALPINKLQIDSVIRNLIHKKILNSYAITPLLFTINSNIPSELGHVNKSCECRIEMPPILSYSLSGLIFILILTVILSK